MEQCQEYSAISASCDRIAPSVITTFYWFCGMADYLLIDVFTSSTIRFLQRRIRHRFFLIISFGESCTKQEHCQEYSNRQSQLMGHFNRYLCAYLLCNGLVIVLAGEYMFLRCIFILIGQGFLVLLDMDASLMRLDTNLGNVFDNLSEHFF